VALVVALVAARAASAAEVPRPTELPARVIVSGRTSTAAEVPVACCDELIPVTCAGRPLTNTPGFRWWVSQHYALKTDYGDEAARQYLILLELAYPHYLALLGAEPPGIGEARLAVVYGSSRERMEEAMASDLGYRWQFAGGGITLEGMRVAYQYPSGSLRYHQRYILLHEVTHLHMMCFLGTLGHLPGWLNEGLADALSSHVFEEQAQRLTVLVHDKAAIPNFLDEGLRALVGSGKTLRDLVDGGNLGRGGNALAVQFFLTDPARSRRFEQYRKGLFAMAARGLPAQECSPELLRETCGDWADLNGSFDAWLATARNTFHYVDWGWEQDGNTLWSYGWPQKGTYSRTDVLLPLTETPVWQPLRMDYPGVPLPPQVGPVARGVAEPVVGCLLDFSRNPSRGSAGLGFGVGDPATPEGLRATGLRVLVEAGRTLVLDGADLGLEAVRVPLPDEVLTGMTADGFRLGLTVRVGAEALVAVARAGPPGGSLGECQARLPLTAVARRQVVERPVAILARDGYHGVTPFFDERRQADPDLSVPAPANRWRFPGLPEVDGLSRSCLRLRGMAPASLVAAREALLAAMPAEAAVQSAALAGYATRLGTLVRDIGRSTPDERLASRAIADVLGLGLSVRVEPGPEPAVFRAVAEVEGALADAVTGELRWQVDPAGVELDPAGGQPLQLPAGGHAQVVRQGRLDRDLWPVTVEAVLELSWRDQRVILAESCAVEPTLPGWWVCGPFPNPGGGKADIVHPPEQAAASAALAAATPGEPQGWRQIGRGMDVPVTAPFVVDLNRSLGTGTQAAAYAMAWLDAASDTDAVLSVGSDDGVVAWVNGERVHCNLVDRALSIGSDRVPVRLSRGRNTLLMKILQSSGDWSFCAGLADREGGPLRGVTLHLGMPPQAPQP